MYNHVKEAAESRRFTSHGVWIEMDSKVSGRILHKGGFTDNELYEIMLDMREISLKHQFLFHFIHVAGSRLISCGVDGSSRGVLQFGNLDEEIYLNLPVDHEPILHIPTLLNWI